MIDNLISRLGLASLLLVPSVLHAQERDLGGVGPLKVRVHVEARHIAGDTTTVDYVIENLQSGGEDLTGFLVDAPALIVSMPTPKARHWLTDPRYDERSRAQWTLYHSALVHPGESTPELTLVARGVPGVVRYWATPNLMAHPADIDDNPDRDDTYAFSDTGTTVGLVPLPADATPFSLTVRLGELLERSCGSLGWIDQVGVCNSLRVKIQHAREALATGSVESARGDLRALAAELDAQHGEPAGKHVSDEAYALLQPNIACLLGRL